MASTMDSITMVDEYLKQLGVQERRPTKMAEDRKTRRETEEENEEEKALDELIYAPLEEIYGRTGEQPVQVECCWRPTDSDLMLTGMARSEQTSTIFEATAGRATVCSFGKN